MKATSPIARAALPFVGALIFVLAWELVVHLEIAKSTDSGLHGRHIIQGHDEKEQHMFTRLRKQVKLLARNSS